jgi:phosphate transport system substrate-binding protein
MMKMNDNSCQPKMVVGVFLFAFLVMAGCHPSTTPFKFSDEAPSRGNIKIGADESFQLLMDTEIFTFQSLYDQAKITPLYKPELSVLEDFMKDSIRCMVTTRNLTKNEEEYLKSRQIVPRTVKIAYDALALIVNNENADSLMQYTRVKDIFLSKITNWKQLNKKSRLNDLSIVFDNEKSGNVRYFVERFNLPNKLPQNFYAVNNNDEVINYVEKHANAIGIISVNWVSDKHDSISHSFLKRVKVMAITSEFDPLSSDYYRPYQGFIADKSYPFIRDVYIINREPFVGLGSGFLAFVAGEKGQRIILKSKLVPATMPVRLVHIKKSL